MRGSRGRLRLGGVTLVELVVVLIVLCVLAAIAIPSYRQHVIDLSRRDAQRELRMLSGRLARCFAHTSNYTRMDGVPNPCITLPYTMQEGTYQISGSLAAAAYSLVATPQAQQAVDAACGAFTLDQLGHQGITGKSTAADCWRESRN